MTILERINEKKAGAEKAPASGVSEKLRPVQNQERLYAAQATPYADAARGGTILQRIQAKRRPNLSASSQPVQTAEEKTDTASRLGGSPTSAAGRYDPTSKAATGLDSGIPVLTSYGGLTRLSQAVPDNTERAKSQTQTVQRRTEPRQTETYSPIAQAFAGEEIQSEEEWKANREREAKERQLDAERRANQQARARNNRAINDEMVQQTPEGIRKDLAKAEADLAQLDADWRDHGEGQRNYGIIGAFNEGYQQQETLSREEYERRRQALQANRDTLETRYRAAKKENGKYTGQYADYLNYAAERPSVFSQNQTDEEKAANPYWGIQNRKDFAQKSQADARKAWDGEEAPNNVTEAGYAWEVYNYLNDIDGARETMDQRSWAGYGPEYVNYQLLTDDEVKVFNYLYNTQGAGAAIGYLRWMDPKLNAQMYSGRQEAVDEWVGQNALTKIAGGAATVAAMPAREIVSAAAGVQDAWRAITGKGIDSYSELHQLLRLVQGVRAETTEDMGGAGQFLTNTLYSAGDSFMNAQMAYRLAGALGYTGDAAMEVANKIGAPLMSNEVFANEVAAAKDKGYSDAGALSLALIRAGVETATELIGGEKVIELIKKNPESFLWSMFLASAPEGLEEVMGGATNEGINLLIDNVFGTEESFIGKAYRDAVKNGENPYLAVAEAILTTTAMDFAGGALSSVGSSYVSTAHYQNALESSAAAIGSDKGTVVSLMQDLGSENPALVEALAQKYGTQNAGTIKENYQADLQRGADALGTDVETVKKLMQELKTEDPAAVADLAEMFDIKSADDFRTLAKEIRRNYDAFNGRTVPTTPGTDPRAAERAQMEEEEKRRQQAGEDWYTAPPVVDAQREPMPGVDVRAENDAQLQEEQQRRAEQQARESAWYTAPPVVDLAQSVSGDLIQGDVPGPRETLERDTPEEITAEDVRRQQEADRRQADENGEGAPFIETGERTPTEEAQREPTPGTDPRAAERAQMEEESAEGHKNTPPETSGEDGVYEGKSINVDLSGEQKPQNHGLVLDTIRKFYSNVSSDPVVTNISGTEFQKTESDKRSLKAKIIDFFNSLGNKVTREGFGEIALNKAGVHDSLEHGYGRLKAATFAALPDVLQKGKLFNADPEHTLHPYDSYLIIAPINVGTGKESKKCYVGAIVIKDANTQRYKVHEVLTEMEDGTSSDKSEAHQKGSGLRYDVPSNNSIPDSAGNSNKNFSTENSRAELEQEYKRRYDAYMAASDANDTEFDYRGEIAWLNDAEKQIGKERAAQIANGEITPGRTDGPVSIDQAEQELLDVGETVVETENGKYRLQVRRQSNGDYMAKVFKDGGEQVARRFSTPEEAAAFASDYLKGQERGYQDAAEEAERSPEQEPEVPTELPDGKEEEREYIRKKKNEAAKLSNPALRDRILRTQSQIDSLKRMDRNPGTRLTEQQRAHIEDLQETLDILVEESNARKQRAKDRRGKAKEAEAKNKESRNKATESARAARSELMKLWHTADGNKAGTADAINKALEEMRKTGRITEESRRKLLDAMMDAGTAAVETESVFADIRREMKNRKVYVSEHDKADFADWKDFRQRAFAAGLYLTNNENDPSADVVNEEMAAAYGEKLFPTDVAAQDALENLVEQMEKGKEARESLSDAIDHWAELEHVTREEILDDLNRKTDEILRTFGQKAELEVQLKDQTADMLQGERERFEARLERQAQRHRETQIRDKVLRGLKRLERLKGRADPETKPAVEAVLRDIDTHAKSMSIERLEDLQALQRAYNAAREAAGWEDEEHPGNWIPNKYVEERLAALTQKHLNEMDIQDVIDLGRTVLALENTIRTNGQMIGEEFDASVAETSQKVREEVESTKGTRGGFLNRWLMEEHLSPTRFLQHLAGWKNGVMAKLAKSLEDGQTRALDFQRRATQSFDPFLSKKENRKWLEKASGKKATWTEYAAVDGMSFVGPSFTKIELTPMMKVSLYLHSLNNDNLRHIQNGGLVIPNKELYIKGDIKNAYEKGARVKMEPEVVRSIVKELTPQELLFARYMQKVFNGVSKDAINEVSLQLDGFERAGVDNYMPIESSRNFLKSDVTAEAREGTVEGIGSIANDRVGGTNPMVLDDASNVLTRQIDKVSRYYGYAIPIRNFQAVYNRVFPGENGESYASSMKEVLGRKWGSGSKQYIEKMLADLQSGGKSKNDPLSRAMSTLRGHLAGATLSFNPAVAISQTASYPGAAQAVGWDGLAHGLVAGRVDPKLIEKYSPLYWYRNQGNSTQELGDYMNGKSLEQKLPWLLNWIQKMDSATIRRLWAASEYRVAKDNPNLQKGTQEEIDAGESEFYKKVAEVFNRAVYDTQPNYTTMERAQILRSESDVTRFLTMYKTVPLQYYGMMVEAAGRLQAARQSGNEAQVKQAQKYALDTFGGLLAANSVYVLMKALFKGFRRKDKDYRDEEGNLTAGSVSKQLGKDLAEVYAGSIIGGAEALSLIKYLTKGGTYQAPEMNALGYVEDMAGAVRSIITAMDSQDPRKAAGAIKDAAKTLAMGFGLPASNMETYILSTIRWASPNAAMEYENMFGGIGKGDLKGMDSKAVNIAAGLILSNRTGERYPESVSRELARLYEAGERAAVPTDIPESFTYGDTEVEIKDRRAYSDAWGEAVGDSLEELLSTDYYQDADDETKARIVDHLFDYATVQARRTADPDYDVTGNSTYGWTARAEEAVANGATLAETITTITAVNAIEGEKDANGETIPGSKRAQTIAYIDGLNTPEDHRDALYMATLYSGSDAREKLEAVEDIGIARHTAITALNDMGSMTADKDKDGKSIANSKRDKISTYIDAMDLSDSQKDELFLLMGYKETSLKYTPWHGYKISGSGSSSGRSGGSSSGRSGGSGRSTGGKTGTVKIPSQANVMAAKSGSKSAGAGGIQTSTASDLIRIIDEMYGGSELAALVDDRRPRGRTTVDFKL